jgi:Bacterial Ig-like domain (group 3)/Galactose oxidase, central domain
MNLWNRLVTAAIVVCGVALACVVSAPAQVIDGVSLHVERRGHTAIPLADGRVLIVGGENTTGVVREAEVFDAASETFLIVGASSGRTDHTATLLADGRVLIAGGRDGAATLGSTEIFNPADNSFSPGPALNRARAGHTATTLADGRILFAGGDALGSSEIYDPAAQAFILSGDLTEPRALHGAALLKDGRVLIAGGVDPMSSSLILDSAETYNPQTGRFSSAATTMGIARALPVIKVLHDGKVQILGGSADFSMEMFNPETAAFSALAHLPPTGDLLAATLSTESRAALISAAITDAPGMQSLLQDPAVAELLGRSDYTVTEIPQAERALVAGGVNSQHEVLAASALVSSSQATVTTDKFDYPPGRTVTITGAGWQPGESVVMVLHEEPETHPDVTVSSTADPAGGFVNTDFAPATSDAGRTFTLTAVGSLSFKAAQTAFTDAPASPSISITKVNGCTINPGPCGPFSNPIHVEGVAATTSFQGQLSQYQVQIDWGDGTVDNDSAVNFSCTNSGCQDFSGTWSSSPDHTYLAGGSRTLTARLYHSQAPGNDSAADSFSVATIIVVAPPTVTTAIHNASHVTITTANAGTTVHDSVTVSGNNGTPTGTVTFDFFNNVDCTGTPTATSGTFTLTSGAADATGFAQGPLAAGSYSFKAHYNGDTNYTAGDSLCEPLTVSKIDPTTVTTTIHDAAHATVTSVAAGATVHDSASISGSAGTPAGTVTFSWFNNGTCTGTPAATSGTFTLTSGAVDGTTFTQTPTASGTFAFQATYNGDGNYNAKTGGCEVLSVGKVNVGSFTTEIHNTAHNAVTSVAAGTIVHDKATLTANGSLPLPTGNVTFNWFTNGDCTGTPTATSGTFTLTSGALDGTTFTQTPTASGSFAFQASYSGDGTYNSATATCETLTVNKIDPTAVTTAIHNAAHGTVTSVAAGAIVHDSVSVTGSVGTPSGTVTFTWFTNGDCSGTPAATSSTVSLTSGAADATAFTQTPNVSGSFAFKATYNGDSTYNSKVGECEVLTVGKVNVGSFTTEIHNNAHGTVTSVSAGTVVHDKATLTANGALPVPTGSVTFTWFTNGDCTGTPTATSGTFTLTTGAADGTTFTQTPSTAGSFAFQASYSGDSTYNSATAACETLTVGKIDPTTVTTAIHNSAHATVTSVAAGTIVHDSVSVSGSLATPTGSVTFKWFENGTCSGTPTATSGTFALTSGAADGTTFTQTPTDASKTYSFLASYSGDNTYNGKDAGCEALSLTKIDPTVATEIHDGSHAVVTSVPAGTAVHDRATVSGGVGTPTGTVTFSWFTSGTCTGTPAQTSGTFTLTGGTVDATTFEQTPGASGSFAFQASYGGDNTYNSKAGPCEVLSVGKIEATVATEIHDGSDAVVTSVSVGTAVHDKGTVTGGFGTPTGTVTFSWFTNGTCSGTPAQTSGTFTLTGGTVDATTFAQTPGTSGPFAFRASYSGDGTYNSKLGPCEVLTVNKIDPTVTTVIHNASHGPILFALSGTSVHDSASVTGSAGTPTGNITFKWFTNGGCTGTPLATSSPFALSGGTVDATTFAQIPSFNTSTSYGFQATYNGDGVYNTKTGECETLTILIQETSMSTSLSGMGQTGASISVQAGFAVTDTATLSGATANAGGTVTYTVYNNNICTSVFASAGTKTVTNGVVPASNPITFTNAQTGVYYWKADYSGDISNASSTSGCTEQLTVTPHTITLAFTDGTAGFVPKLIAPLPKGFKSPGVEVDVTLTDILHDAVSIEVIGTARNVANNCAKPLTPSTAAAKQFSVPVSQGNLDTVQLAFKLFEVTKGAMNTAKKAKCESLTLEVSEFSAFAVDAQGVHSNTLLLLGEGDPPVLNIVVPIPTKKKSSTVQTLSDLRAAAVEEAEFKAMKPGTQLPPPERR